jgi:hypothetical protein
MSHRLASALALGTTLALSGAALAKPTTPPSPAPSHDAKKSKAKHAHNDNHQKPAAPSQKPTAPKK